VLKADLNRGIDKDAEEEEVEGDDEGEGNDLKSEDDGKGIEAVEALSVALTLAV